MEQEESKDMGFPCPNNPPLQPPGGRGEGRVGLGKLMKGTTRLPSHQEWLFTSLFANLLKWKPSSFAWT